MTFPYLKEKYSCPGFYIDVPYEKTQSSIKYVANQLKELKHFFGRHYRKENYRRSGGKCRYKQQKSGGTF
ncbi:MAG: 2-hydroxyacyl-CoA dehydratase family protein [Lachnospira sp.]